MVSWCNTRPVLTIPNFIGTKPMQNYKSSDKKKKEAICVSHPPSVGNYNKLIGGVEKVDMLLDFKTK